MVRRILHVDMDAFFAAIEQRDAPALRGQPVLVGHDGPRGVVSAASYEARPFGCHSAQPMAVAKRLCPQAIVKPVRGERYRQVSKQVFAIFDQFTPLVEPLSVDEAFLDVTGSERLLGTAEHIAQQIKNHIRHDLNLTASVGVAPNKFLAKLGSDLNKPDGLTVIEQHEVDHDLGPLPVHKIWGIGPTTAARLEKSHIRTIGDLRDKPLAWLQCNFGNEAEHFYRLARGIDNRVVAPPRQAKSISQERTFERDVTDPDIVQRVLFRQVETIARRLRKHRLQARTVSLKIRYGEFQTINRSRTSKEATESTADIWQVARSLFEHWSYRTFHPVRLIGIAATGLSHLNRQMELFCDAPRRRHQAVDVVADRIADRFGKGSIGRAAALDHFAKGGTGHSPPLARGG